MKKEENKLAIYQAPDGAIEVQIDTSQETLWANIDEIAFLFGINKSNVSRHIHNIFELGEIEKNSTVAKNATVQKQEGKRLIKRSIEYFSLDIILAVGYRARSTSQAIAFRNGWAYSFTA